MNGGTWLYRHGGKRLLDLLLAVGGLFFFALPMAWIAWRIFRKSKESPLFRQPRIGRNGTMFLIMKFRTILSNGQPSRFCQRLRATAMDELPQLIHILKGEMSFVGPRPIVPEELKELHQFPSGAQRLQVRPGLAGLAQIYGPKAPSLPERLRWDLAYVDGCSLTLDVWILLRALQITLAGAWETVRSNGHPA